MSSRKAVAEDQTEIGAKFWLWGAGAGAGEGEGKVYGEGKGDGKENETEKEPEQEHIHLEDSAKLLLCNNPRELGRGLRQFSEGKYSYETPGSSDSLTVSQ